LIGSSASILRVPAKLIKKYSIKSTTAFKLLFNVYAASCGLDVAALDFFFVTSKEPLSNESCPQQHFMVSGDEIYAFTKRKPPIAAPTATLALNFRNLFNNPTHSDVILTIGNNVSVYAHKAILSTRCEKFRSMLQEGRMKESNEKEVRLQIETQTLLVGLLEYIYTDSVSGLSPDVAFDLMAIADEYLLPGLWTLCENHCQQSVNCLNVCCLFRNAHLRNALVLKNYCLDFMTKNFDVVSKTAGYEELKDEPDLLLEISREMPSRIVRPVISFVPVQRMKYLKWKALTKANRKQCLIFVTLILSPLALVLVIRRIKGS